jgi:hypothetical protein
MLAIFRKRSTIVIFNVVALLITAGLLAVALRSDPQTASNGCKGAGKKHYLTVQDDRFSQPRLQLAQCDTLIVQNRGNLTLKLALGVHDAHISYPGFKEQIVVPGGSLRLEAVQAGSYQMHDHLRDNATTQLIITGRP